MGYRGTGQDPPVVETLLPKHPSSDLRRGQHRQTEDPACQTGAAEHAARGRLERCYSLSFC